MSFQLTVEEITVMRFSHGEDRVYLRTSLPNGSYPYEGTVDLEFKVARGSAEEYLKKHFPDQKPTVVTFECLGKINL